MLASHQMRLLAVGCLWIKSLRVRADNQFEFKCLVSYLYWAKRFFFKVYNMGKNFIFNNRFYISVLYFSITKMDRCIIAKGIFSDH